MKNKTYPFRVHPAVAHANAILKNLPTKTGKNKDEWSEIIATQGETDEKIMKAWLKKEFGLGGTTILVLLDFVAGRRIRFEADAYLELATSYVTDMFAKKQALLPIYQAIMDLAYGLGDDVAASPCKTIIPLYRNHVFAEIKPSTRSRLDLSLALRRHEGSLPGRATVGPGMAKGDRLTHKIGLCSPDEVDDEIRDLLKLAYSLDS